MSDSDAPTHGFDWSNARYEYITGHESLRALARRHGLDHQETWRRAKKEKWQDARREHQAELDEQSLVAFRSAIVAKRWEHGERLFTAFAEAATAVCVRIKSDAAGKTKRGSRPLNPMIVEAVLDFGKVVLGLDAGLRAMGTAVVPAKTDATDGRWRDVFAAAANEATAIETGATLDVEVVPSDEPMAENGNGVPHG